MGDAAGTGACFDPRNFLELLSGAMSRGSRVCVDLRMWVGLKARLEWVEVSGQTRDICAEGLLGHRSLCLVEHSVALRRPVS